LFGLGDTAVELGERDGPRLRVAKVDAERREQLLRRTRRAAREEVEVRRREGLRILAIPRHERERDEVRERVRVRVEADVDEVRDVRPAEAVAVRQLE